MKNFKLLCSDEKHQSTLWQNDLNRGTQTCEQDLRSNNAYSI